MYYFGFSPKSAHQFSPFIFNHAQDMCWPTSLFPFYSKHPSSAVTGNLSQYENHLLLPFTCSVSHQLCSSVLLSFSWHSSTPLLLPCSLRALCFPPGSSNTEFKLTFLFQVPYFEPAHTLQMIAFPACVSDFFACPQFLLSFLCLLLTSHKSFLLPLPYSYLLSRTACLSLVKKHSPFSSSNL